MQTLPNAGPQGMTTSDVVADLVRSNPERRFAVSASGDVVAVHVRGCRWMPICALLCTGEWARVSGLPYVNGKPAVSEWVEF